MGIFAKGGGGGGGGGGLITGIISLLANGWAYFRGKALNRGGFQWDFTGIRSLSVQTYLRFGGCVFTFYHQNLGFG